jgi:hypothetical protein
MVARSPGLEAETQAWRKWFDDGFIVVTNFAYVYAVIDS